MASYRFCRTDDIQLLVEALNRCWSPYFPDEPRVTPASFKRSIRDLQVWCSSCMVAFSGADPIGVLIGAKRPSETLVHKIAVHPDHLRQGHGRHLLESLGSKLAILGPHRIIAEVAEAAREARGLFNASGYVEEAVLTDYDLSGESRGADAPAEDGQRWLVIPVTLDDLSANGLTEPYPPTSWERSLGTLTATKDAIAGLAIASDEQIEAYLLYAFRGAAIEIVSMRSLVEHGGARLEHLLCQLRRAGSNGIRFPKVHEAELSADDMRSLGFRSAGRHLVYSATPRSQ